MLNLFELEQFVSFADNKTLTKVSEILNISHCTEKFCLTFLA